MAWRRSSASGLRRASPGDDGEAAVGELCGDEMVRAGCAPPGRALSAAGGRNSVRGVAVFRRGGRDFMARFSRGQKVPAVVLVFSAEGVA